MAWQASPEKAIEDYIAESNERDRLVGTPDYQIELFTREETLVKQPKPSINYLTHLRQIVVFLARPVSLGIGYFPPRLVYEFIKASVHAVIASALRSILWLVR